ncbi:MAG: (Fe-S)-binding protein [SAR324 cluster bacterium]|nr:(Fe-S)-binding protein [SAR324 cluster bacterium]
MDPSISPETQATPPFFKNVEFDGILSCVHCGLCLDVCPTYRELGLEQDSPRGRLYIMRGLWQNELELNQDAIDPLNRCLDCRACETACPSNVKYGELLEKTRGIIQENLPQSFKEKLLREVFLKRVLISKNTLQLVSVLMNVYMTLKIPKLITSTFLSKILPKNIVNGQSMLPRFSGSSIKKKYAEKGNLLPTHGREKKFRVSFFTGCIMDVSESATHEASLKLLRAAGCEVAIPQEQSCCGALHVHSGDRQTARTLAKKNLAAFGIDQWDAIITNAAGCGAQLKEYHPLFSDQDSDAKNEWHAFEEKVIDILEFLSAVPDFPQELPWKNGEEVVLYDAPCHLKHAQGVDKNPQKLLNLLPGVRLVPLTESDWCCGSAGIYNLIQADLSNAVLQRKLDSVEQTLTRHPGAKTIVTGNPGCLFQIRAGIQSRNIPLRVIHPVEYMAERLLEH